MKYELERTLLFLSDDRFRFDFVQSVPPAVQVARFFDFGDSDGWRPDAVMLFSGGLDSLAGALEQLVERRNRVALVSHFSSTKLAPIQRRLCLAMGERVGTGPGTSRPVSS